MSIKIHLNNNRICDTPEAQAARELACRFQDELKSYPNASGNLYIYSDVKLYGQHNSDIDILLLGSFSNFIYNGAFNTPRGQTTDSIQIDSLLVNIELKSHDQSGVKIEGTKYFVLYGEREHNATKQCDDAKYSLLNYIKQQTDISPRVFGLLWFNALSRDTLNRMRPAQDNALPADFGFNDLITTLSFLGSFYKNGQHHINCFWSNEDFLKVYNIHARVFTPKGLTRKKFELLSQDNLDEVAKDLIKNEKFTILTGRAGTGKTVQLLQIAYYFASAHLRKRCAILTYNKALVSDIQRLIDFTPMPSGLDGRTVAIKTIDSFFQSLFVETGVAKGFLDPTEANYKESYHNHLVKLYEYVGKRVNEKNVHYLKEIVEEYVNWDYVLIDEAQDVENLEKDILFKIYSPSHLIVADGVDQFMRGQNRQDWTRHLAEGSYYHPGEMTLERRQKSNLATFVNAFAHASGISWAVQPNREILGGKIIITRGLSSDLYRELEANCKKNDCEDYDILILEPSTYVGPNGYKNSRAYEAAGISLYDGTRSENRSTYPTKNECRMYQYDSCRGLEGWCVVCDHFDTLVEIKMRNYIVGDDELGFDPEVIKKRNVLLWALMPLTRAVDTLVITIDNHNSEVGTILKSIANEYKDFVNWKL